MTNAERIVALETAILANARKESPDHAHAYAVGTYAGVLAMLLEASPEAAAIVERATAFWEGRSE
jgi:hypothetical protein